MQRAWEGLKLLAHQLLLALACWSGAHSEGISVSGWNMRLGRYLQEVGRYDEHICDLVISNSVFLIKLAQG